MRWALQGTNRWQTLSPNIPLLRGMDELSHNGDKIGNPKQIRISDFDLPAMPLVLPNQARAAFVPLI
jgi:hypothetical protein